MPTPRTLEEELDFYKALDAFATLNTKVCDAVRYVHESRTALLRIEALFSRGTVFRFAEENPDYDVANFLKASLALRRGTPSTAVMALQRTLALALYHSELLREKQPGEFGLDFSAAFLGYLSRAQLEAIPGLEHPANSRQLVEDHG